MVADPTGPTWTNVLQLAEIIDLDWKEKNYSVSIFIIKLGTKAYISIQNIKY